MPGTALTLLLLFLIACGTAGARDLAMPRVDTSSTGVIHVTNTGPTAWADTTGWRLVLERTIAPPAGAPGELIDPRSLVVDSHGRIFLLDSRPSLVKIFEPDGSFLGSFAQEGAGPGEISDRGLLMVARDTIVIQDIRQTRATAFTRDGEMITEWPSLCCMGMNSWADASGHFPVPGMVYPMRDPTDPLSALGFVRYTSTGMVADTILYPASGIASATWDGLGKGIPIPLQPADRYLFTTDGRVVAGHQSEYRLAISPNGRDTVRSFTGLPVQVPIPEEEREIAYQGMVDRIPGLDAVASVADLPMVYPPWEDARSDGRGNIWVMVAGPAGNRDHWEVFSPDGILLGSVAAPFTELQRTFWTTERVHVVVEDQATGLAEIQVYRIERGGG